ncbi:MAG: hypothetical protein OXG96_04295 [Acidobacteria bacterium]|nr:hypothetical protein [Acidobacteriota bacterium]
MRNAAWLGLGLLAIAPVTPERARATEPQTEAKPRQSNPDIPSGIVPGVRRPAGMVPLKVVPGKQKRPIPFYARLRAEVDRPFLTRGEGRLYLGFHLDPLYAVHWNNRVKPLEFRLETAEGVRVTPRRGIGPKVKPPADKDPREFLLDIAATGQSQPLHLTVRYFACDDADTFCIPVTQRYTVFLEPAPRENVAGESPGSLRR